MLAPVHERFAHIDARLDKMDARFDRIDDYLLKFRSEVLERFETIDRRVDFLAASFSKMDVQLPVLNKSVIDFGILAGQIARERMEASGHELDLLNRIVKLEEKFAKLHPAA
jgi:hypothetical protein